VDQRHSHEHELRVRVLVDKAPSAPPVQQELEQWTEARAGEGSPDETLSRDL
jgi:hypothetical protein